MVDRAALEMPCPERDPGFESLALRQNRKDACGRLFCTLHFRNLYFGRNTGVKFRKHTSRRKREDKREGQVRFSANVL